MLTLRSKAIAVLSVFMLTMLLAGGCKEDSTTEPQKGPSPTIVSFSAEPSTVAAGGDSVTLSWEVNDASSLSISPGIGSVTPVDSGSMKVFVSSSTTFTLTASNSVGEVTSSVQVNAALTMTVNGYVKGPDGEPIPGITVLVKGKTSTTAGSDGSFTIPDVVAPYEISIVLSTTKYAVIYQGLTRSDPTLLYLGGSPATSKHASISGYVPAAPGRTTTVCFISGTESWSTQADQLTGFFAFNATWYSSVSSYTGNLMVLRWTSNTNGLPSEYDAYGSKNLTISEGGTFTNNNFAETDFSDPAELNINGSIVLPTSSYEITSKQMGINFGNAGFPICNESGVGLTDNFSYTVPSISGGTFEIGVVAAADSRESYYLKTGITGGSSGITVTLERAPQLNLPVNNGTGVDTTTQFLWTQGGGTGVNMVRIRPQGGDQFYTIMTAGNTTSIPNLSPLGMGLPSGGNFYWHIWRYYPFASIDDAASDLFIQMLNHKAGDFGHMTSESFNFTTHL